MGGTRGWRRRGGANRAGAGKTLPGGERGQSVMKDCDEEDSCVHRDNFDLTGGRRALFPRVSLGWTAPQVCLQRKRGTSPPPPPPLVYAFLSGLIWFPLLHLNFCKLPKQIQGHCH